jgi:hypothetical protein
VRDQLACVSNKHSTYRGLELLLFLCNALDNNSMAMLLLRCYPARSYFRKRAAGQPAAVDESHDD